MPNHLKNQLRIKSICQICGLNPVVLGTWLVTVTTALLFSAQAAAFDTAQIAEAPPELLKCLAQKVGIDKVTAILEGNPPKDKKSRRRIKKAYEGCAMITGAAIPKDIISYSGPLFDAMSQIDETVDHRRAIARVRKTGVTRLALFARSKKRLHQNEKNVLELARQNPDLIVLGSPKFFRLDGDLSKEYIQATIEGIRKYGYRFIGEILYTHADKKSGKQHFRGERYVDPSGQGTSLLLQSIATLNIPLMTHWEPYAPERDFPRFHDLYDAWPGQVFIVPHMGFASPEQVDEFMRLHANLYMVISKKERVVKDFSDSKKQASIGSAMLDGFRLRPQWKDILIKYQDRLIFGTDPHMKKLWKKYPIIIKAQRLVLGQLPPAAGAKIAHENAERLYGIGPTTPPTSTK